MVLLKSIDYFAFGFKNVSRLIKYFRYSTFIIVCLLNLFCIEIGSKKDKVSGISDKEDASYAALNYKQIPAELRNIKPKKIRSVSRT